MSLNYTKLNNEIIQILVIGSGGREAVILKKLKQNINVKLYCIGTNKNPTILNQDITFEYFKDIDYVVKYCQKNI
jgi:phosphoribosylamine-glycine ligase